jgi:Protein of unknown function (DUF3618)
MGSDAREVRRQVEEARDRLGDTVEALVHRANAPRRAKDRFTRALARVSKSVQAKTRGV